MLDPIRVHRNLKRRPAWVLPVLVLALIVVVVAIITLRVPQ